MGFISHRRFKASWTGRYIPARKRGSDGGIQAGGYFYRCQYTEKGSEEVNDLLDADRSGTGWHQELKRKIEITWAPIMKTEPLIYMQTCERELQNEWDNEYHTYQEKHKKFLNKPIPMKRCRWSRQPCMRPAAWESPDLAVHGGQKQEKIQELASVIRTVLNREGYDMYQPEVLCDSVNDRESPFEGR